MTWAAFPHDRSRRTIPLTLLGLKARASTSGSLITRTLMLRMGAIYGRKRTRSTPVRVSSKGRYPHSLQPSTKLSRLGSEAAYPAETSRISRRRKDGYNTSIGFQK